jgi:hypothetical protein
MYVKHMAAAAAIATGVGMATLTFGVGLVNAAPLDPPPPCPNCQPGPGDGVGGSPTTLPNRGIRIPCTGPGSPRGGGGVPICEASMTPTHGG